MNIHTENPRAVLATAGPTGELESALQETLTAIAQIDQGAPELDAEEAKVKEALAQCEGELREVNEGLARVREQGGSVEVAASAYLGETEPPDGDDEDELQDELQHLERVQIGLKRRLNGIASERAARLRETRGALAAAAEPLTAAVIGRIGDLLHEVAGLTLGLQTIDSATSSNQGYWPARAIEEALAAAARRVQFTRPTEVPEWIVSGLLEHREKIRQANCRIRGSYAPEPREEPAPRAGAVGATDERLIPASTIGYRHGEGIAITNV